MFICWTAENNNMEFDKLTAGTLEEFDRVTVIETVKKSQSEKRRGTSPVRFHFPGHAHQVATSGWWR